MLIDFHTHSQKENTLAIESLSYNQTPSNAPFTFGIHPWHAHLADFESFQIKFEQLRSQKNFLTMGEIGLDRVRAENYTAQQDCYLKQLILAQENEIPYIVLHCVRALDDILIGQKEAKYRGHFIFHDANFNREQAHSLIKAGHYLSLGRNLLRENSKIKQAVSQLPLSSIFFESDDADLSVLEVYQAYSDLSAVTLDQVEKQCQENFKRLFPAFKM